MKRLLALAVLSAVSFTGCAEPRSLLVKRPENPVADTAVTKLWTADIERVAQDGDWILSRSYYMTSDAIATFTSGEDLSHASIYDAKKHTVIESIGSGVREIPLEQLVGRNAHLIVVRPSHMTAADRSHAVDRARTRLGQAFDTLGLVGLGAEDKVYCSELVWWSAQMEERSGVHERVVTPSDLLKYGEVVYWSGERDDDQIQNIALSSFDARVATR